MSKTLSKRFQEIVKFKLDCGKVTAVKVYRVHDDCLGDDKVMSAVAYKEMDLYELVSLIMTDELYRKYRNYWVVAEAHDGDVYKVWIRKQEKNDDIG